MEVIQLREDYIRLGQALKAAGFVGSGVDEDRFKNICLSLGIVAVKNIRAAVKFQFHGPIISIVCQIYMHLRKSGSKGIAVDGQKLKKAADLLGLCNVVFFSPEDLGSSLPPDSFLCIPDMSSLSCSTNSFRRSMILLPKETSCISHIPSVSSVQRHCH